MAYIQACGSFERQMEGESVPSYSIPVQGATVIEPAAPNENYPYAPLQEILEINNTDLFSLGNNCHL